MTHNDNVCDLMAENGRLHAEITRLRAAAASGEPVSDADLIRAWDMLKILAITPPGEWLSKAEVHQQLQWIRVVADPVRRHPAPSAPASVREDLADLLAETECADVEELRDMTNVGKAFMARIDQAIKLDGPFKNWSPAECPSEIIFDLINALDDGGRPPPPTAPEVLAHYDAGLLNDHGGGNVEWWQDYIRAELERAHDFYQSQSAISAPEASALTDETRGIATNEEIAREIALSYGRDPDELAPWHEFCDEHNNPLPIFHAYLEQAERVSAAFEVRPRIFLKTAEHK